MAGYVEFVTNLIYGSGAEAVITPNHSIWVAANPTPSGTEWLSHHVDVMLPAYGIWAGGEHLPPVVPWNGVRPEPWDPTSDIPLGADLDGGFAGIASLDDLGAALRDRYTTVAALADELLGIEKAPFSYRYWGYVVWARQMRDRYQGEVILPTAVVHDRDGTPLSAIPFTDVFNELHWNWHLEPAASGPTPGLSTSAGQRAGLGGVGMGGGEEFALFHRDHTELFSRWLARTGQPPVRGRNMYNANTGWPGSNAGTNPSTWVEADDDPWINDEAGDTDGNLQSSTSDVDDLGGDINSSIHGSGHLRNTDIAPIFHNNYVPRFHAWHGWIDNQLWWRAPRFARWDATTGLRERVFEPVLSDGSAWPGLPALTIERDPTAPADVVAPFTGVPGIDLTTGTGTLRYRFHASDSYGRQLRLRLRADVFDDATDPTTPVETIPEATHTYLIGDTSTGDDFDLATDFEIDIVFGGAFQSDDPTRSNPAVGFVNSRIAVTGTLEVADGSDPGFGHTDSTELTLVQEKAAPDVDLYFDLGSFGLDQVDSAMSGGEARFEDALIVVVQDRTSAPAPPVWPADVADEVKGLITGFVPVAGLFRDTAKVPTVDIVDAVSGDPIDGLSIQLGSGPVLEDATLADNLPQRFTYRYDVVFTDPNEAFDGMASGAVRWTDVTVRVADRSGNVATADGAIKLFNEANPFMRDGDVSWLSIDTRVFRLFEGDAMFDATLAAGHPNDFVRDVVANLNAGTTGGDTFDALPTDQPGSSLEYSTTIDDPSTGSARNVHNFTLAKVRLQGASGAADVRAFFRLFRYTATNLVFDATTAYRTHDDGTGGRIPLLGFSAAAGGDVISIPFFADERLDSSQPMTDQTDPTNVQIFVAGPTDERVLYFGAYLDINQDSARLPDQYLAAHPDGGFGAGEVQSIRSLMTDAHQCMVVEVAYDGDPTTTGDTPAASDNLAQRNLMILYTDNPGGPLTHTVEHSFEIDTGKRLPGRTPDFTVVGLEALLADEQDGLPPDITHGVDDRDDPKRAGLQLPPAVPMRFVSSDRRQRRVIASAFDIAMVRARNMQEMMHPAPFLAQAERFVDQRFPFVFDRARWQSTIRVFDELLIDWGDLPDGSRATLHLPGVDAAHIINLRNLRHAPGDVTIVDRHTIELTPGGATFVPVPHVPDGRVPGVLRIELPDGIRKGQRWAVDVVQLRGAERRAMGGFRVDIQVIGAAAIADAERRLLIHMFDRLTSTPRSSRWHPVLARRVDTIRARAEQLAASAGVAWDDPTVWVDPQEPDRPRPLDGRRVRVVLERVQILDDRDPWIKGKGEIRFRTRVHTANNGGRTETTAIPDHGVLKVSDKPGHNVVELDTVIFDDFAADDLRIEIIAVEEDTFDPDDSLGKYTRLFCGDANGWFGIYGPNGEVIEPEDLVAWRVWYRIERS